MTPDIDLRAAERVVDFFSVRRVIPSSPGAPIHCITIVSQLTIALMSIRTVSRFSLSENATCDIITK